MTWGDEASRQDGVITRRKLRSHGLSDSSISHLHRSDAIRPVEHGVFLVRGAPLTYRARLWTAALASEGLIGFATGAYLWGVTSDPPDRVDVLIDRERRFRPTAAVRPHRVTVPPGVEYRVDGLPVTSRTRTLLDYVGRQRMTEAQRVTDRALQRGWLKPEDIEARLQESPGRTGNRVLRALLAGCGDGAAAESERVLHRLLRRAGLSRWQPNFPFWVDGELIAVLDVAMPEYRLAIEVDGWAFHSDTERFQRDRTRQNALQVMGWTVLRFTWTDLVERPAYVIATIRAQLR